MTITGYHILSRVFKDEDWKRDALCKGRTDIFYADRNSGNRKQGLLPNERKAKSLCVRCPVRLQCLAYGLTEEFGIWGGTMPSERRHRADVLTLLDEMTEQAVKYGLMMKEGV